MVPVAHRVRSVHRETHDTCTLWLDPLADALAPPAPGQFVMAWAPGVGEVPISVAAHDGAGLGLTIRSVGAVSAALVATSVGGIVGLRGPFGRGWSEPEADRPALVVAGGLGLAPLRLQVERLLAARSGSADPQVTVVVGARSPGEIPSVEVVEQWSTRCNVHVTVDTATAGWHGEVGMVTATLDRLLLPEDAATFLCGPEVMMRFAAGGLVAAGLDPAAIEVSLERSMACAIAHCGRCQVGPVMLCRDGPVLAWSTAGRLLGVRRW
jgi:NAD(P)H-flavin reductase